MLICSNEVGFSSRKTGYLALFWNFSLLSLLVLFGIYLNGNEFKMPLVCEGQLAFWPNSGYHDVLISAKLQTRLPYTRIKSWLSTFFLSFARTSQQIFYPFELPQTFFPFILLFDSCFCSLLLFFEFSIDF